MKELPADAVAFLKSLPEVPSRHSLAERAAAGQVEKFCRHLQRDFRSRFTTRPTPPQWWQTRVPGLEDLPESTCPLPFATDDLTQNLLMTAARLEWLRRCGGELEPEGLFLWWQRLYAATLPEPWLHELERVEQISMTERSDTSQPLPPQNEFAEVNRLLCAEVCWAGSVLFDGMADRANICENAAAALQQEFDARTDTDGTPHAETLSTLPIWFGSLVRATGWAKAAHVDLWEVSFWKRLAGLTSFVAIQLEGDGRIPAESTVDLRPLVIEATRRCKGAAERPLKRFAGRLLKQGDEPIVAPAQPGRQTSFPREESVSDSQHSGPPDSGPPDSGPQQSDSSALARKLAEIARPHKSDRKHRAVATSDWGKVVAVRSAWRPWADTLTAAFAQRVPSLTGSVLGHPFLNGAWDLKLRLSGSEIALNAAWENVCWFSDEEGDYAELQWPNAAGLTVCRQIYLSRGDHRLLLADSVAADDPAASVHLESVLPFAAGVESIGPAGSDSSELRLRTAAIVVRVFPLTAATKDNETLPADGATRESDSCSGIAGAAGSHPLRLISRMAGTGSVYSVWLFDWHPARHEAYADWRNLTVAEEGVRLSLTEACGIRFRLGSSQWLIYRAMRHCTTPFGTRARRTVLGYHHTNESVIARFTTHGEVEPLVLVE